MEDYERQFLEDTLAHLSASMGNALREGFETETILDDKDSLSEFGSMWVQGYLLGQLAVVRGCSVGNPNVSPEDIEEIGSLVDERDGRIASAIYS